jgi:prepilin-type processing-associated H-X9-DG protein
MEFASDSEPVGGNVCGGPSHYTLNAQGTDRMTPRGVDGDWPEPPLPFPEIITPVREANIRAASDLIALGDVVMYDMSARSIPPGPFPLISIAGNFNFPEYQKNATKPERIAALPAESQRHRGLFNVVFCDAHVESLKTNKLFGVTETVTRRWNRDHEPHAGAWK